MNSDYIKQLEAELDAEEEDEKKKIKIN